jgi:hypothetical protein
MIGTKVRYKENAHNFNSLVQPGDTGVITQSADYVPGLDASQHTVWYDNPRSSRRASSYWTLASLFDDWEVIA